MGKRRREKRMREFTAAASLLALVCLLALAARPVDSAAAEGEASSAEAVNQASDEGITVTLTADKSSYQEGEEIHYTIAIENGKGLSRLVGGDFSYTNKGLVPAAEDSMPASFPEIQPGETFVLSGVLVGDETVSAPGEESSAASRPGDSGEASQPAAIDSETKGSISIVAVAAAALLAALLALLCIITGKRRKKGNTRGEKNGKEKGRGAGGGAGALALVLALCMAGTAFPAEAAADKVTLRPYLKLEYAGREVMIRAVLEFRMEQERWVVDAADKAQNKQITCHDPSIFRDRDGVYYVLGTHITGGRSTNLYDWISLDNVLRESYSPETRNQVRAWNEEGNKGDWFGYLWAPDVIYNEVMGKYCVYLSADGDNWKSNIVMLTADYVTGPYEYAGTVVYSGFTAETFGETDAPGVLDAREIPERYVVNGVENNKWGDMWPNCIDPCVFYADDGRLLMAYGSWSGGIFMLELDP